MTPPEWGLLAATLALAVLMAISRTPPTDPPSGAPA
jgi:hypothetical protein